eukprot:5941051-Alexandrium_andersonii.AAC.1
MSASLVGSEMCIRDSLLPRACRLPSSQARARRRQTRPAARREACGRPVSYTHLTLPTICSV